MSADPIFICDDTTDRAAWLEARREGIGASEAPICMGISPFGSRAKMAAEKGGLVSMDDDASELQRAGRYFEGPMLQMFADEMEREGHKGWQVKLSGRMYRSTKPGREVMTATMDGQATDPAGRVGVVECKLKIFGASEWERHGIPDYVVAQGQHQADVVDGPFTLVLALLGGYRLRWRVLERDDELLGDVIVPAELDFWERYQAGEAFPIDEGAPDANADLLRRLYPEDDGTTVTLLGQEWVDAARQWRLHATAEGAHKKQAKVLKSKLQGAMGNASFAKLDGGATLSNLTVRKGEQHHKATTYRVLREVAPKKTGRRR